MKFGLLLSSLGFISWNNALVSAQGGNSDCAHWCAANFAHPGSDCTSLAAHGDGPCYVCGPRKTVMSEQLCAGQCVDTATDSQNCGACGNICPSGSTCQSGTCLCANGKPLCNGQCPDFSSDSNNCGECGHVCDAGSKCVNGVCSNPTCDGKVCGTYINCSPTEDCQCYTTPDGTGFCAHNEYCAGLPDCNRNADCGPGSICAVDSCCVRNVCIPPCGAPAKKLVRMAKQQDRSGCWSKGC